MVALLWPAGTATDGSTAASAEFELESVTSVPPTGATPLSITVPVDVPPLPPEIFDGLSLSDVTVGPVDARTSPLASRRREHAINHRRNRGDSFIGILLVCAMGGASQF